MDSNFDEAMNIAGSVEVDFGEGETVITEAMDQEMAMDFNLHEQRPISMDTSGEEIEYLEDFPIASGSNYVAQNDIPMSTASEPPTVSMSNCKQVFEMKSFEGQTVVVQSQGEPSARPPGRPPRQIAPAPKIVPIAPKPTPYLVQGKPGYKIGNLQMKKLTVSNAIPGQNNTVVAQIGKQLVVVPGSSGPKFRIVPPGGAGKPMQAQVISGKSVLAAGSSTAKPIVMKLPAVGNLDQPAVLTKIVPQNSAGKGSKIVTMHPKTVPVPNNVLLGAALNRPQQYITVKSQGGATTKKVIISSNAAQSLIRKQAVDGKIIAKSVQPKPTEGQQQTQIHQIHVPGKGVQYIRLVTNSNAPNNLVNKRVVQAKPQGDVSTSTPAPRMHYVFDDKGNVVPIGLKCETTVTSAPTANTIVVTSGNKPAANNNVALSKKFVRIAPVTAKVMAQSPASVTVGSRLESLMPAEQAPHDTKAALKALIEEVVDENISIGESMPDMSDAEVTIRIPPVKKEAKWSLPPPPPDPEIPKEHPLIVIPSDFYTDNTRQDRNVKINKIKLEMPKDDINSSQEFEIEQPSSPGHITDKELDLLKPRKACNCTKSQCLKLYCDCFANGEFCNNCNCNNCHNNLQSEEARQKAIRGCLERNPNAFRPKIGKTKATGPSTVRRHNKGCNCKRSGCLKNYCECYEAKIACSGICKCVGCRNVDDRFDSVRRRDYERRVYPPNIGLTLYRSPDEPLKQPCMFMTSEVIDAVCQCLLAAAGDDPSDKGDDDEILEEPDPMKSVIEEFSRCLQDIISASHQPPPSLEETSG